MHPIWEKTGQKLFSKADICRLIAENNTQDWEKKTFIPKFRQLLQKCQDEI